MVFFYIFGALAFLSCLLLLWQYVAAVRFPLHHKIANNDFVPAVTLLKPLKGSDSETERCLRSWFEQEYRGPVQILFGVAAKDDPVCNLVRDLIAKYPKVDAELVICSAALGPNAKVSSLIQLEAVAKHDIIVISDADVLVPRDLLTNIVVPLKKPETGLVNCFYCFANPSTPAMRWEAVAVNADFWSQVLQSKSLKPIDFALGAVMLTSRETLKRSGGFESLVDYLADDYQLGNRIAKIGKKIELASVVVECWESPRGWRAIWNHQLRWARTIRICQPAPFFFSILSNPTIWPLIWFFTSFLLRRSLGSDLKIVFVPVLLFIPFRMLLALKLEERLTNKVSHYGYFWIIPIKDLLNVAVWALAFFGNSVEWRGERFKILSGGKLEKQR